MTNVIETTSHFEPFPQEKISQMAGLERRRKPGEVHNPYHPDPAKRGSVAAMGMGLAHEPRPAAAPVASPRIPPGGVQQAGAPSQPPQMPRPMAAPITQEDVQQNLAYVAVTPNAEAESVSYALPSNFLIYDNFKDLYIKPFKGRQFSKLVRARDEESLLHMVEAVSSVLYTTADIPAIAFELSLPDFYACLYWLRLNSFMKHGFVHRTTCRSVKHHEWVQNGRLLEDGKTRVPVMKDTLQHAETITKATLKTKMLERLPDPADYPLDNPNIRLVFVPMREVLELTMNDSLDPFTARTASSFQPVSGNVSLQERMLMVDDLSGDDIATIDRWEHDVANYGVEESLKWQCKTCGHVHTDEIQLEAHSFFPSAA